MKRKYEIEEAINHAREKAQELDNCECGMWHEQLALWLEELQELRKEKAKKEELDYYANTVTLVDMPLSTRVKGSLQRHRINTLKKLLETKNDKLSSMCGLGKIGLEEIFKLKLQYLDLEEAFIETEHLIAAPKEKIIEFNIYKNTNIVDYKYSKYNLYSCTIRHPHSLFGYILPRKKIIKIEELKKIAEEYDEKLEMCSDGREKSIDRFLF